MPTPIPIPISRTTVVDRYFLEHRAKLIDLAAFLDRVERAVPADGEAEDDFRVEAMRRAIEELLKPGADRARRVQETFSDPTDEPIDRAPMKGALGAHDPSA